jgi:hypothetical protein
MTSPASYLDIRTDAPFYGFVKARGRWLGAGTHYLLRWVGSARRRPAYSQPRFTQRSNR